MEKNLPSRPNLDHLRRQAKALLSSLSRGEADAVAVFRQFLPAAKGMTAAQVRDADFRLADAQSAVARQSGFAAWPQLSRHVEQLRAMEGTWMFRLLEVDGTAMPPAATASSRLLIDGDRFRTESPGAVYEGVFNIDVEAVPHHIDIEFVEGPEAGNTNRGIFRVDGDTFELCLDMHGKPRPAAFMTTKGSGHAYEVLRRSTAARPDGVTGGDRKAGTDSPPAPQAAPGTTANAGDFPLVDTPLLRRLPGEWAAVRLVRDGAEFPPMMLSTGRRSASGNEVRIHFGGQLIIHALIRIDESSDPVRIDYLNIGGVAKGTMQQGIMRWQGDDACFCMAAPGRERPTDFTGEPGDGRTLSVWRPKKPERVKH